MKHFFTSIKSFVNNVIDVDKDVTDFRGNWLHVQKFFQSVQRTSDAASLAQLEGKLPLLESHLDRMIELLLREREQFASAVKAAVPPDSTTTSTVLNGGPNDEALIRAIVAELPPCYRYLLRDPSTNTAGLLGGDRYDGESGDSIVAHSSAQAPVSPENDYILFNNCQYAKHDQPTGSRRMLLHFLYRLITEADLPLPMATQHSGMTLASLPPAVSLLHLCRNFATLPIVDAVHRVARELDPWVQPGGGGSTGSGGGRRSPVPVHSAASKTQASKLIQQDRVALVALCRVLCEKLEQFPQLSEFFVVDDMPPAERKKAKQAHQDPTTSVSPIKKKSAAEEEAEDQAILKAAKASTEAVSASGRCLLLDILVRYVKDHCVDLSSDDRLQTVTNAMRGVLALAKSVDPKLQSFVGRHVDLRSVLLHETCTTILTVSKIPLAADELRLNMAYVTQVATFVDAMLVLSPHVAQELSLAKEFESHVIVDTLMNLFRSPDERVFLAAVTILTEFLKQSFAPGHSMLGNRVVELLLRSRVNTVLLGTEAAPEHQTSPSRGGRTSPTPKLSTLLADDAATGHFSSEQLDASVTFADAFFYPRLADMSDNVVCCTIQLFTTMCQRFPHSFMSNALQLDALENPLFFSRDFLKAHARAPTHQQLAKAHHNQSTTLQQQQQHEHDLARLHAPTISFSKHGLVPDTTINGFFPTRLYSPKGLCGTTMEQFSDDTLKLMLLLETAMTTSEVLSHRLSIERIPKDVLQAALQANAAAAAASAGGGGGSGGMLLGPQDDAAVSPEAIAELSNFRSSRPSVSNCAGSKLYRLTLASSITTSDPLPEVLPVKYQNLFFSPSVHNSTLVATICRLVESFVDQSFAINTMLTELIVSLVSLPDLRVAFTLLGEAYRPVTSRARHHHHHNQQSNTAAHDDDDGALAPDPTNLEGKLTLALKRVTSRIDAVFDKEEQQQQEASAQGSGGKSPVRAHPVATSQAMYWRFAQRPFFDAAIDDQVVDETFVSTLRAMKPFVEACLALEGLRHELDSAVCYHLMGQRFAELSSAPQR